ncbi:hypothetical protein GF312_22935 [Candidatus Poribacteria bacterium]|nr:hypothetical protein [Candidatus Poribacteria bacterium]
MKKRMIFCILIIISLLVGCGEDEGDEEYVSNESARDSYYYPDIQNQVFYGTWGFKLEITQGVSDPSIAWYTTGFKYVIVTIFKGKIDLKDNRIANFNDAIWTWHTGLGKGREGNISYYDGQDMRFGEILDTVTPLEPGTYYITAWGYDDNYDLFRSTQEYEHVYQK